jgi:hypothetical protein
MKSDVKESIDLLRGDIPRSRFIVRLVESYIQNNKKIKMDNKTKPVGKSFETASQQGSKC